MEILTIKGKKFEKIEECAKKMGELVRGCRNQTREEERKLRELIYQHGKNKNIKFKKGERYTFLMEKSINFGTSKYPDNARITEKSTENFVKETEKTIFFEYTKVLKRNLVGIVEE